MFADIKTLAMFSFANAQARYSQMVRMVDFQNPAARMGPSQSSFLGLSPTGPIWDLRDAQRWVLNVPKTVWAGRAPMKVWHIRAFTEALVQDRARPPRRELRDSRPCSRSGTV